MTGLGRGWVGGGDEEMAMGAMMRISEYQAVWDLSGFAR